MIVLDPNARYGCAEVAAWLEHTPSWFSRHRHALERADGFPKPIWGTGRPRWLGADLIAWEQRSKRGPEITGPDSAPVFDLSPILRARAIQVAGGKRQ